MWREKTGVNPATPAAGVESHVSIRDGTVRVV